MRAFILTNCIREDGKVSSWCGNPSWWTKRGYDLQLRAILEDQTLPPDWSLGERIRAIYKGTSSCKTCGAVIKAENAFCSHECARADKELSETRKKSQKATLRDKYGVENPGQLQHVRELASRTMKTRERKKGAEHHAFMSAAGFDRYIAPKYSSSVEEEFRELVGGVKKRMASGREIDIQIPGTNVGVEVDGLFWHSKHDRAYHLNKSVEAASCGIDLIHFYDFELTSKKEICKSILDHRIGKTSRTVHARKCKIRELSSSDYHEFCEKSHLSGYAAASVKYGLFLGTELISCMSFARSRFDKSVEWEMIRFCNKPGYSVVGGASRLFKHFCRENSPASIVSFSDRRLFFNGTLYTQLGFSFAGNTKPNYWYWNRDEYWLHSRLGFQKHLLHKKLPNFDSSLSESENMQRNGWFRVWDCGSSKWVWTNGIHT